MRAIGSSAVIKMCEESVWGVTPNNPSVVYGIGLRSETLGSTKNLFQSDMINSYRAVIGLGDGNRGVAGNIVSDFLPEGLEVFFKHLLGNPTIITTGSGPFTHVMKGSPGELPGLSIEKGFENIGQYIKLSGCRLNSATIALVQEGFHSVTFDFIGKSETTSNTSMINGTPIWANKNGFTGYQVVLSMKRSDVVEPFTDLSYVVSGNITINNNVETDGYVLGSSERASAIYGKRQCSGDFSVYFEDLTMYNYYISGTECHLRFTFNNNLGQIWVIDFPRCKYGGTAPQIAGAGGLNLPLTFTARVDEVEGTDVIFTITNTIASF